MEGGRQGPPSTRQKEAVVAAVKIIQNKDGTVTVRHGRIVSHIDIRGLPLLEAIDEVRWAAIGIGIVVDEQTVWDALRADD
jgi:hypothetical protein